MVQKADGQNYAPKGETEPVCPKGEFEIGVVGLDHGHIYGMCNGLIEAGASVKWVYDSDVFFRISHPAPPYKYIDIARDATGDHVYLVNHEGETHFPAAGLCGFPFFGRLIRDCMDRTQTAMNQAHALRAIELAIEAQTKTKRLWVKRTG